MSLVSKGKPKKKGINGRQKGHNFERKLAKILSKWSNIEICRTPQSGGWAKSGDLTPKRPKDMVNWPLNVEAKCYARDTFRFQDLLKSADGGAIMLWWKQCIGDAKISGKTPMLVFTQNYDEIYVLMRDDDVHLLSVSDKPSPSCIYSSRFGVVICLLTPFLQAFSVEDFKNAE